MHTTSTLQKTALGVVCILLICIQTYSHAESMDNYFLEFNESPQPPRKKNIKLDISHSDYKKFIQKNPAKPISRLLDVSRFARQEQAKTIIKISYKGNQNYPVLTVLFCKSGHADLRPFMTYRLLYGNEMIGRENIRILVVDDSAIHNILRILSETQLQQKNEINLVSIAVYSETLSSAVATEAPLGRASAKQFQSQLSTELQAAYPQYLRVLNFFYNPLNPFENRTPANFR